MFEWMLCSRDEFDRLKKENPDTLTDIQRAVRFFYLLKTGYSGTLAFTTFSSSKSSKSGFNLLRLEEILSAAHLRLSRVYIENRPYARVIENFDNPDTFFYIDPPYWNCENYYGKGIFAKEDYGTINELLMAVKGRFIMSINDAKEIRDIYRNFNIKKVSTTYSASPKGPQKTSELLITNF